MLLESPKTPEEFIDWLLDLQFEPNSIESHLYHLNPSVVLEAYLESHRDITKNRQN